MAKVEPILPPKERHPTKPYDVGGKGVDVRGITFYHASPVRFRHGDLILGGKGGGSGYGHTSVCMTTSLRPHVTIAGNIPGWPGFYVPEDRVYGENEYDQKKPVTDREWYVYEVQPLGPTFYEPGNVEYQTKRAVVIQNMGKATAFLPQKLKERSENAGFRHMDDPAERAYSPDVERERKLKFQERNERRQKRIDDRNQIEAAMASRVASRFLTGR